MVLECNIDSGGKYIRLLMGIMTIIGSIPILFITLSGVVDQSTGWMIIIGMWAGGGFSIFEGWSGWCVVRSLGFQTPI